MTGFPHQSITKEPELGEEKRTGNDMLVKVFLTMISRSWNNPTTTFTSYDGFIESRQVINVQHQLKTMAIYVWCCPITCLSNMWIEYLQKISVILVGGSWKTIPKCFIIQKNQQKSGKTPHLKRFPIRVELRKWYVSCYAFLRPFTARIRPFYGYPFRYVFDTYMLHIKYVIQRILDFPKKILKKPLLLTKADQNEEKCIRGTPHEFRVLWPHHFFQFCAPCHQLLSLSHRSI